MSARHTGRHGNDRRFLYKGIWVRVFSEWCPETWNVLYNRAASAHGQNEIRGKYQGRSRREIFQKIRFVLALELNPDLGKVTDRLMGKKNDPSNLTYEKFQNLLNNPFGDKL